MPFSLVIFSYCPDVALKSGLGVGYKLQVHLESLTWTEDVRLGSQMASLFNYGLLCNKSVHVSLWSNIFQSNSYQETVLGNIT